MPKTLDLRAMRFGRLTALRSVGKNIHGNILWKCICSCKERTQVIVKGSDLVRGTTQSCGCLRREQVRSLQRTKHGHAVTNRTSPEYLAYMNMKSRCFNQNNKQYQDYGGRGITMCDRWQYGEDGRTGFECFLADIGLRPDKKHSIERVDNNGNYDPENCTWAKRRPQAFNTRRSVKISFNGEEKNLTELIESGIVSHNKYHYWRMRGYSPQQIVDKVTSGEIGRQFRYLNFKDQRKTIKEWAAETGIPYHTIAARVDKLGWSVEKALTTDVSTANNLEGKLEKTSPEQRLQWAKQAARARWGGKKKRSLPKEI